MIAAAAAGHFLSALAKLDHVPVGRRALRALDQAFDLAYVRFRLEHEGRAIDEWLRQRPQGEDLRISIVTPTYGITLPYIEEFLASIKSQTHRKWELCLCLDGPQPPGVEERFRRLARKDPRVRLVSHSDNGGICAATRSALALASGDVVVFCDADDLLHRKALRCLAASFAEADDVDFVYSDLDACTDYGFRIAPHRKPDWSPDLLASTNYINHVVAARRSILERLSAEELFPDDVSGAQDWNFCFLATRCSRRIRHVPFALYHWRRRPGSVAHDANAKPYVFEAALRVLDREYARRCPSLEATVDPATLVYRPTVKVGAREDFVVIHVRLGDDALRGAFALGQSMSTLLADVDAKIARTAAAVEHAQALVFFEIEPGSDTIEAASVPLDAALPSTFSGPSYEPLAAHAMQSGIACAWPFHSSGARIGYTLGGAHGLVPIRPSLSPFASNAANILAGPLHGCLLSAAVLDSFGGLAGVAQRHGLLENATPDRLGVALAFEALSRGLRNVSVPGVTCTRLPAVVAWDHGLPRDPFLF